jgi:hypothetical protein
MPRQPAREAPLAVGDVVRFLRAGARTAIWPPDAFAVAGSLLNLSGAYTHAVKSWPPRKSGRRVRPERWLETTRRIGHDWRRRASSFGQPPAEIRAWWRTVLAAREVPVHDLADERALCDALVNLCAAADEASVGVGIPSLGKSGSGAEQPDAFEVIATDYLLGDGTLCASIDASRVRVLPKLHAPKSGMTMRSLTHHLALCRTSDIQAQWRIIPGGPQDSRGLNLLIVPWPKVVRPRQFKPASGGGPGMPPRFGFFVFEPDGADGEDQLVAELGDIIARAKDAVGEIHLVCFPELALTATLYDRVKDLVTDQMGAMLIAGVCEAPPDVNGMPGNCLRFVAPSLGRAVPVVQQSKHHRWRVDGGQVRQYGLGTNLTHNCDWWEFIALEKRALTFVAINPWLTMAALICEDLARQDPAAELVRAVGPNLVIALLMDGPQLNARWPARYATVLADDPGSSVLTITSIGMSALSRPNGIPPSRVVALWKDAKTGSACEIALPHGADGVVLTLSAEFHEEWTADGRSDGGATGYPVLTGIHPTVRAGAG